LKKLCSLALCFCLIFPLAVTAFASYDISDYIDEYSAYLPEPVPEIYGGVTPEFIQAHDAWIAGLNSFAEAKEEAKPKPSVEDTPAETPSKSVVSSKEDTSSETTPTTSTESAGSNHVVSTNHADPPLDTGLDDKYPVGSRVDSAGNVYSPSGELLSPGTTPATAPAPGSDEDASISPDELADQNDVSTVSDTDALAVIAGLVSDIATDPPTWYVDDLRSADPPVEVLTGLKSLVTSIFGEYTPVTTTSVISETVGNDTHQYLVETVAPGAAGVDYEWVAGVLLFAIMLYCLMKLLGGVLK